MTNTISVAFAGETNTFGPIIAVLINTSPNFFRKWSFLKLRPKDKVELNKTVETSRKWVADFHMIKIEPAQLAKMPADMAKTQAIVHLLNTQREFWNETLTFPNPMSNPELFYFHFTKLAPGNLRQRGFDFYKWGLNKDTNNQQLAQCFADYYLDKEIQDIKNIWEVGGVIKPDCPHIREVKYETSK